MKINPLTARLCLWCSATLTLVGIILRTVAMFISFDSKVGYFNPSLLTTLMTVVSFAAVLLSAVLCIVIRKDTLPQIWPSPRRHLAPVFPFALFASSSIGVLWYYATEGQSNTTMVLTGILGLVSAIYYLLLILQSAGKGIGTNALAAIGYAPVLWSLLAVAETYTDQFTTMNSPIKLSLQFGFLSIALMMVAELRFLLNKPAPRAALYFHAIALYFCLTGSIPTLLALGAGILNNPLHGAYALALLGVGIYAAFKLVCYFTISASEITPSETSAPEAHETDSDTNHIIGE